MQQKIQEVYTLACVDRFPKIQIPDKLEPTEKEHTKLQDHSELNYMFFSLS